MSLRATVGMFLFAFFGVFGMWLWMKVDGDWRTCAYFSLMAICGAILATHESRKQ